MILLPPLKRLAFLLRNSLAFFILIISPSVDAQQFAAYQDNQGRFIIFDNGKAIQAEYLPVKEFSIGGDCILYIDNRNHFKMYYHGEISTLEVGGVDHFETLDYLSVYSIGSIVKIIEKGIVTTITTHAVQYQAQDSLVTFYDLNQELLAVYYKGHIRILEDGLAGKPYNNFRSGDNIVAYVSARTWALKAFYNGKILELESNLSGGSFKVGRDIVAFITPYEQKFKVFLRGGEYMLEEFPPESYQVGDGIVAYVDNTGSFKIFQGGETTEIASYIPDFYGIRNQMVLYGERGYFKVWYNQQPYLLETSIPTDWKAEWNTIIYRDLNRNIKIFREGELKVLTYDLAEEISLYRDVVVVNKGMNNHNVYYNGRKY
jgi:hypothetical protein